MMNLITCTISTDSVGFENLGPDQDQEKIENLAVHESLFEIGLYRIWYLSPVRLDRKSLETPII